MISAVFAPSEDSPIAALARRCEAAIPADAPIFERVTIELSMLELARIVAALDLVADMRPTARPD